ncbi:MAG: hypothetical protein UY18_C0041G0009 [Microgenomates group bacterium GW2011_GWF2_47_9]|nr:MAG: hypothetical protein UY18_C0041G0009 [Microgenomates group bacterium GW2011_GWF2_47_9]
MDTATVALAIIIIFLGFFVLYLLLSKKLRTLTSPLADEEHTRNIVNQVFGEVTNKVIEQTKMVLSSDKEAIYKDNAGNKSAIQKLVTDLELEMVERQREIKAIEADRNKQFGEITKSIEEHRKITDELRLTTESLGKVLSNNQTRGQWGERIIEDILKNSGLIEGIHYARQKEMDTNSSKPDITLLLPNNRKVAVDVKFPYSEIKQMADAESKSEKSLHIKKFESDVKAKINQVTKYINVEEGTLDYAIMFVPNELLFSFINREFPDVIDAAMAKKVMIVSPFTFLIVARTVMESYRNFMVENNLRKIIKHISEFIEEWGKFTTEFNKFDDSILKLRDGFDKIRGTRYKMMESKIKKVESYRQGNSTLNGEGEDNPTIIDSVSKE